VQGTERAIRDQFRTIRRTQYEKIRGTDMTAGWASTGYDQIEEDNKQHEAGEYDGKIREFWTNPEQTKRIVIVDDAPFGFWAHSLYNLGVKGVSPICLDRNPGLSEQFGSCPFCAQNKLFKESKGAAGTEMWPSYVAYITVIDCGAVNIHPTTKALSLQGWVNDKDREYNFDRKILPLKKGGKDKPGLLKKVQRLRDKKGGSLVGCVFDLYRGGKKEERPGTEWEFVTKMDVTTLEALKEGLKGLDGINPDTHPAMIDDVVKENGVVDYMDHFQPQSASALSQLFLGGGGGKATANKAPAGGYGTPDPSADGDTAPKQPPAEVNTENIDDEDIPF